MFLCHKTIRLGLVVYYVIMLRNMVYSRLCQDFCLNVTFTENKNQPGFPAEIVGVCVNYKSNENSEVAKEGCKCDSEENQDDLCQEFIKSIENGCIFSQVIASDTSRLKKSNEAEDDDMRATIDRLRVGVAIGTILGFVFGVLVTGVLVLLYTKKVHRLGNSRSSPQIDRQRKTQENGKKADHKHDNANYTYCDINYEICQRPTESSSKSQNSEESHKYQDCNLNTYNHLNENNSNNAIRSEQYDHIREACADSVPSDGEYRMLEPVNSMQEVGILPIEKPTSDMSKPSDNNYFELENVKCQATNPDAYFVLEKDSK